MIYEIPREEFKKALESKVHFIVNINSSAAEEAVMKGSETIALDDSFTGNVEAKVDNKTKSVVVYSLNSSADSKSAAEKLHEARF